MANYSNFSAHFCGHRKARKKAYAKLTKDIFHTAKHGDFFKAQIENEYKLKF